MSRKNKKGYKHPDYIAIYRHTFKSAAWQALSVGARAAYLELASNYNTKRMNAVYLAARTGAEKLGVNKDTITKWLRELQHYGFIALVRGGSLGVEGYGLAQTFRLTDRPFGNTRATYDFQNWDGEIFNPEPDGDRNWRPKKPDKKQNPVRPSRTPRPAEPDIENSDQQSSLCPAEPDIETAPDRPAGPDITSFTSCELNGGGKTADVEARPAKPGSGEGRRSRRPRLMMMVHEHTALTEWSPPPVLTEVPPPRFYCEAVGKLPGAPAPMEWSTPVLVETEIDALIRGGLLDNKMRNDPGAIIDALHAFLDSTLGATS